MSNKIVNEILRDALEGENLSSLTKKLDLPKGFLFRIVKENRSPSLNNIQALIRLADYIGISLEELLTGRPSSKTIVGATFEDQGRKYRINIDRVK